MLEGQGMTLEKLRRAEERQFIAQEFVRSMIFREIHEDRPRRDAQYYEEHPADFTAEDKIVWQDIFIDAARHPTRKPPGSCRADRPRRAKNGEDFATLAKQLTMASAHMATARAPVSGPAKSGRPNARRRSSR